LDTVQGLGTYVEIEAIDETNELEYDIILEQCNGYMTELKIDDTDLISVSYSDMIVQQMQSA